MAHVAPHVFDYHFVGAAAAAVGLPRCHYFEGERIDNVTDWALKQFRSHYKGLLPYVSKDDIFHYVYGVLHDPIYLEKYALNLKREFPRIPFYADFRAWADWGGKLMALHIGFETIDPWPIRRVEEPDLKARTAGVAPKAILKPDREAGTIRIDNETTLFDIPPQAFDYRLGDRSGLDWILDQYKERTPKDPTIREKFNTYRFKDYKEKVIDLITRVTRVSVETVAIVEAMRKAER
jgi:predicted helicase